VRSLFLNCLQSFDVGVDVSVHAVSDSLVLDWAENFVGACLISDLLEASSEHFGFESFNVIVF